jgi:hypothetical protein
MFILAQHLLRTGKMLPLQAVFTSSETLHEMQREAIERALADACVVAEEKLAGEAAA